MTQENEHKHLFNLQKALYGVPGCEAALPALWRSKTVVCNSPRLAPDTPPRVKEIFSEPCSIFSSSTSHRRIVPLSAHPKFEMVQL